MMIDDLMEMPLKDVLDMFCIVYSPECGYYYGVASWDDVSQIYDKYDLEEEYCFEGDCLIPLEYNFECGEDILELQDLECIMDRLGIVIKQACPKCDSSNYHLDYNQMKMVCEECGHTDEPKEKE